MSPNDLAQQLRAGAHSAWIICDPFSKREAVEKLKAPLQSLAAIVDKNDSALVVDPLHTVPVTIDDLEPGRPSRPSLVAAADVPKRQTGRAGGRGALLHAIAHIEFNAINLALDAVWRYPNMPISYAMDWVSVALDESRHFTLLCDEMDIDGVSYGDFAAHDGLWDMARRTASDLVARMALVPRVLEARGLDATPVIQRKLKAVGDQRGVDLLQVLLDEEIRHVYIGDIWFRRVCASFNRDPDATYRELLIAFNAPWPKPPLNHAARLEAGFSTEELAWLTADKPKPPGITD